MAETLRDRVQKNLDAGVDPIKLREELKSRGFRNEDYDLPFEEAKSKASSRKYYAAESDKAQTKKVIKEAESSLESSFSFDTGTASLEKSFGLEKKPAFRAPQMDVEALGQLKVGGTPITVPEPIKTERKQKEKVVVPLAQEVAEAILPKETYEYLPEFAAPETKETEKDLRLEVGPSIEKLAGLGYALGKEGSALLGEAREFYGVDKTAPASRTSEVIKGYAEEVKQKSKEQSEKDLGVRIAEFPSTFVGNAKDVALGLAELVNYYAGINVREGVSRQEEAVKKAEDTVASLLGVPIGVVAAVKESGFIDTIENKPIDFIMTLAPAVKSLKAATPQPVRNFISNKLTKALDVPLEALKQKVPRKASEYSASTQQFLSDAFKTSEPETSAFIEQTIRTPEASAAAIKEASVKMSREKPALVEEVRPDIVNIDPLRNKPDDLITIKIDGNPIEVKNKYLSSIDQEGFENINTASEVGAKAKAIYDDLQNSKKRVEELKDTVEPQVNPDSINDAIELYDRMLNENVDAPVKELENFIRQSVVPKQIVSLNDAKQLRDYFEAKYGDIDVIKTGPELVEQQKLVRLFEGKQNNKWKPLIDSYETKFGKQVVEPEAIFDRLNEDAKLSFVENIVDYVKERNNILNKTNELSAVLSDRVVAPAKTREFYSITDEGRLSRGPERIQDVVQTYLKRLERKRPEGETKGPRNIPRAISEQTDILTSETFEQPLLRTKTEGAVQRLEQQKVKEVSRREPIKYLVKNEKYNKALSELANEVIKSYPDDVTGAITPERLASRFAFALDEQLSKGLPLLRSPELKRNVLKSIDKRLTGFTREQKRNILKDFNDTILREAVVENNTAKLRDFEIKDKNGNVVLNGDIVRDIIFENDKEAINAAKERAIVDIGEEIAQEAQYYQTRQAIKQESQRFFQRDDKGNINPDAVRNPEVYLFQVLSRVIGKGEALPVLSPFEGKKLANIAREAKETYANKIAQTSGFDKDYILKRIDSIADRYERMEKTDLSNIESLLDSERITQFKKVQPDNAKFDNLYALPEVNNAYKWEFASRMAGKAPMSGLALAQMAKRNLTARSLPSIKNNMLSNMLASSLKSGNILKPLEVFDTAKEYSDFKNGKQIPDVRRRAYDAIDRSGLFDTTELIKDLGATKASDKAGLVGKGWNYAKSKVENRLDFLSTTTPDASNMLGRGYDKAMMWLEDKYSKFGDVPFKLEEATRTYERMNGAIDLLSDGEYIQSPISKNTDVRFTKRGDRLDAEMLDKKGNQVLGTKKLSGNIESPEISKLLGRAAAFEANKLFFDYGDVGNFNKQLRSFPVSNFLSGFYTWYSKSLDIPGIKRGLVSNTLFPSEYIVSNSPKVIQRNLDTAAAQSARKAALVSALRGSMLEQKGDTKDEREIRDLVRRAVAFAPKDADTVLIGPLMDPSYIYYNDFTNTVPFKATDILSKLGGQALLSAYGFTNSDTFKEKLFPFLKAQKQEDINVDYEELKKEKERLRLFFKDIRGEEFSAKDILSLVGLGGNAIVSMLDKLNDSEAQGKVVDPYVLGQEFAGAWIGKTPASLLLSTAGLLGQATDSETLMNVSPYAKEQRKYGFASGEMAPDVQPMIRYLVSQVVGSGWKKTSLLAGKENVATGGKIKSRFEQYLIGAKKELEANLVKPLENRSQQLLAQAENETDPVRKEEYEQKAYLYINQYQTIQKLVKGLLDEELAKISELWNRKKD